MNVRRFVSTLAVLLVASACTDARDPLQPPTPSFAASLRSAAAGPAGPVATSGHFDAIVDFSTVSLMPKGGNCLLQVDGRIVFSGTIQGTATGRTSALEFGPCSQVAVNPPGTFPDVFKSVATFQGTIDGRPAKSDLLYMGRVAVGGAIDGRFVFSNGIAGALDVNAIVAVGGTYRGQVVVR